MFERHFTYLNAERQQSDYEPKVDLVNDSPDCAEPDTEYEGSNYDDGK